MNLEQRIQEIIEELIPYNPQKVVLFGEAVEKKNLTPDAELDIAIIKDTEEHIVDRLIAARGMLPRRLWPVDIKVYTRAEFAAMRKAQTPLSREISNGRVLYELKGSDLNI